MKLLHVTMYYWPIFGGQTTFIANLNKICKQNGIQYHVIQPFNKYRYPEEKANEELQNVTMTFNIKIGRRFFRSIDKWFMFNYKLFFYRKFIKQYDVVLCHYPYHYPAVKWHKNVLVLSQGLDWHKNLESKADRYRKSTAELVKKDKAPLVSVDSNFLRFLGHDLEPGENLFQEVSTKTWLVPNPVDTDNFYRDEKIEKEKIILVVRTIRPERGIHLAIEAFGLFFEKHPDYSLEIIGAIGDKKYYEKCRNLTDSLGIMHKVKFYGAVTWERLNFYYNRSMISIVPTVEMEGTSLSALESMAAGTPVISTSVGGLADLPTIKAEADSLDIAMKMEYVLKNHNSIGEEQKLKTIKIFSYKKWGETWMNIFQSFNT